MKHPYRITVLPINAATPLNAETLKARPSSEKPMVPATKPRDAAFPNALRPHRMRIGLRFIGD